MDIDYARSLASAPPGHLPGVHETSAASLVVLLAILDKLEALTAAPVAASTAPDEKPRKGKAER